MTFGLTIGATLFGALAWWKNVAVVPINCAGAAVSTVFAMGVAGGAACAGAVARNALFGAMTAGMVVESRINGWQWYKGSDSSSTTKRGEILAQKMFGSNATMYGGEYATSLLVNAIWYHNPEMISHLHNVAVVGNDN